MGWRVTQWDPNVAGGIGHDTLRHTANRTKHHYRLECRRDRRTTGTSVYPSVPNRPLLRRSSRLGKGIARRRPKPSTRSRRIGCRAVIRCSTSWSIRSDDTTVQSAKLARVRWVTVASHRSRRRQTIPTATHYPGQRAPRAACTPRAPGRHHRNRFRGTWGTFGTWGTSFDRGGRCRFVGRSRRHPLDFKAVAFGKHHDRFQRRFVDTITVRFVRLDVVLPQHDAHQLGRPIVSGAWHICRTESPGFACNAFGEFFVTLGVNLRDIGFAMTECDLGSFQAKSLAYFRALGMSQSVWSPTVR